MIAETELHTVVYFDINTGATWFLDHKNKLYKDYFVDIQKLTGFNRILGAIS